MRIIKTILLIIFLINCSYANEIKTLVQINNQSITNIDLIKEIQIRELLDKRKLNDGQKKYLLQTLIDEKIKKLEITNYNLKINESIINKQVDQIIGARDIDTKFNDEIKNYIYNKIETNLKWNQLITILFSNKLEININEINEKIKSNNIDQSKSEEIIKIEKTKKINIISNTFFNEVKKKYLVRILE